MSDLTELLERVKAATGPDSELADAVWLAVIPGAQRVNKMAQWPEENPIWEYFDPARNTYSRFIPNILGSIDAALALTERMLPAANCKGIEYDPSNGWCAYLSLNHVATGHWYKEAYSASSAPLAILAALLSALIAQDPQP